MIHIPLGTIPVVLSVLLDFSVVPSPARIEPETLRSQDEFFRARDEKLASDNLTVSGWWFSNHLEKIEFVNGFGIILHGKSKMVETTNQVCYWTLPLKVRWFTQHGDFPVRYVNVYQRVHYKKLVHRIIHPMDCSQNPTNSMDHNEWYGIKLMRWLIYADYNPILVIVLTMII